MREILKLELRRAFKGKGMIFAIIVGCAITITHVIQYQIPAYQMNLQQNFIECPQGYPLVVSDTWMAGNSFNIESFLYFLVLPIIAVIPFGTSYFADRNGGFLKSVYMRISRKEYLTAKYIATFLSGGAAVALPLVLNVMCCMVLLPNIVAQQSLPHNTICAKNLFYGIYYSHPTVYIMIYLCLDFILGGIFACMALTCSFLSDFKVIVAICPFFIQLTLHVACSMLWNYEWSSVFFARAGYGMTNVVIPLIYILVGILITSTLFLYIGEKEDVF